MSQIVVHIPLVRAQVALKPRVVLMTFAFVLLAAVWGAAVHEVRSVLARAKDDAVTDAGNYARLFSEHIERSVQSADQAALFLKYQYERNGADFDLQKYLATGVILGDIFNLYTIVDRNADVALSSKPFTPMNLADREHVKVHFEEDSKSLFIGKPVLGRVSGKWSIQMTRRINAADGGFGGVVVVSMDPFYFTRFYGEVSFGGNDSVTLIGTDGIVRARLSGGKATTGQDVSGNPVFRDMLKADIGTTIAPSGIDQVERIFAYRKIKGYPMYILVGLATRDVMKEARDYAMFIGVFASLVSLVVIGFALLQLRMIDRLEKSRTRAEAASEAKSQFLANMSHELRTPLNGILGYAELLEGDLQGTEQSQFAQAIRASGTHLLALVNSVLDIGKVEKGRLDLLVAPTPLRALLDMAIQSHLSSSQLKGLDLSLRLGPALPQEFACDRTRLMQVLNNLLHNAIKFTGTGGVRLEVSRAAAGIRFAVVDTGPGIAPADQARVFEQFEQVDASLVRNHEGTGLGLAIARQLVALMGGTLQLDSEPGKGATFAFTLPEAAIQGDPT